MKIFIPVSKTDPNGKGVFVHIADRADAFCPRHALIQLALALPTGSVEGDNPLFASTRGKGAKSSPLTNGAFVKRLKKWIEAIGLDSKDYSGHSLRRGGATALLHAGVDPELVQIQGRWRSVAYKIYVQWASDKLLAIMRAVGAAQ